MSIKRYLFVIKEKTTDDKGRVLLLYPMKWLDNDWCSIGEDSDGRDCGVSRTKRCNPVGGNTGGMHPCENRKADACRQTDWEQ